MTRIDFSLVRISAIHSGLVDPGFLKWMEITTPKVDALTYYLTKVLPKAA